MIAWFPAPYPDETFDSLCYRYARRMQYPSKTALGVDWFGQRIIGVTVDMPHHLAYLIDHLPPGTQITAYEMIENHTFLPYYQPFLRAETYACAITQILGEGVQPNVLGALSKFRKHVPVYLRYCPACASMDRQAYGETYWHRQHQLPSVHICGKHAFWLEDSPIYAKHNNFSQGPVTAEEALQSVCLVPRPIDASPTTQRLFRLSQNSIWVLSHKSTLDAEGLYPKYRFALQEQGYLSYQGVMHRDKFLQDFLNYYSDELLGYLGDGSPSRPCHSSTWANRLTEHYHQIRFSPLQHLILIQFLCEDVKTFFTLPDERRPFGEGPWPCLNPACPHYHQPVITQCHIYYAKNRPRAEFQCACGFTYRRWGPDQTEVQPYSYDWVVTYGKVWEDRLQNLWDQPDISLRAMKTLLGVESIDTLKGHAIRLGLPFKEHRDLKRGEGLRVPLARESVEAIRQQRLAARREQIRAMLADNPSLTRKQLSEKAPTFVKDLIKFDYDGLNRMAPLLRYPSPVAIDWQDRDASLAQKIPLVVEAIISETGKPLRITKTEIGRRLAVSPLLTNYLPKLPKTKAILDEVIESREAFAIRRVEWAKDVFIQLNQIPRRPVLIQKAGVEKSLYPSVITLVDNSLIEIIDSHQQ